jgi:transposase
VSIRRWCWEATYGWYWAVDVLSDAGAQLLLAHPSGVKAFTYRWVKNDVRDAADLADPLRMGRLPEAYAAPPAVRELRRWCVIGQVGGLAQWAESQRARGVGQAGPALAGSDLFGVGGRQLLAVAPLDGGYRLHVNALCRLIDALGFQIDAVGGPLRAALAGHAGYQAVQTIPGVGPVLAAVFVAEVGQVGRFASHGHLSSWAGLTRGTASPTPWCAGVGSPNGARAWCAGPLQAVWMCGRVGRAIRRGASV